MAIVLISAKKWSKKGKKLVAPMDYIGFDCTNDTALQQEYSNIMSGSGMAAKRKIYEPIDPNVSSSSRDDLSDLADFEIGKREEMSEAEIYNQKLKKLQKHFMRGKDFMLVMHNVCEAMINERGRINIFLIFENAQYKYMADRMQKYISKKLLGDQMPNFILTYDDLKADWDHMKDTLSRPATDRELELLAGLLNAIEKEYGPAVRDTDRDLSTIKRKKD